VINNPFILFRRTESSCETAILAKRNRLRCCRKV